MPDDDYWQRRRFELLDQMEADEKALNDKLARVYASEEAKLRREIAAYYAEYGEENVIEYRNLLASLSDADRRLLIERMDEFGGKYPEYAHLLPVRGSIYQLDRLEGLQYSIWLQQMEIGAIEQAELEAHLSEQAQRAANLAADEMGFGSNFYSVNDQVIRATIGARWASGQDFSERIWGNRERLAAYLSDDLAKGFARGLSYDSMARMLVDRFDNVSKRDAMRLVYTEGTFVFNEAQAQVHEQTYDYYQLSTITDDRTCEVCKGVERAQDAEPMAFEARMPGVNFPPLHPNCRCSYTVFMGDWDQWIEQQAAGQGEPTAQDAGSPEPFEFTPAKTIKEAERYAREVIGCEASYKGIDLEGANALNEAVASHVHQFPELKKNFGFIGSIQECNKRRKDLWAKRFLEQKSDLWDKFGFSEADKIERARELANHAVGRTGSRVWAWSYSPNEDAADYSMRGICLNTKFFGKGKMAALKESLKGNVEAKWHPEGADTLKSIADHEIGHQLDALLGISRSPEFREIKQAVTGQGAKQKDLIKESLSQYAAENDKEFVAEAWSEWQNNGSPRKTARSIGELIERKYKELFGGQ